jgi:tetratricopeptide (TPR) repeat protein
VKTIVPLLAVLLLLTNRALSGLIEEGDAKAAKGDWDNAIIDYTKAIALEENDAVAYNDLGVARFSKDDLDEAILDFNKAIELKPDFAGAYGSRGAAKMSKFDFDGAISDFNKAIALKPDDNYFKNELWFAKNESTNSKPVLYLHRGKVKKLGNNLDGAIADYSKAIELKPDFAEAYFSRGFAKKDKGDLDGAITDYTKAIELKPNYALAYNNRGWCEFLKNDFSGATNDATRAIQINTNNRSYYDTRGWARYEAGDVAGALQDCETAVGLSQIGTWQAVETQGLVNFINGDYGMAREQWENTFHHDPSKKYLLPFIEKAKQNAK